MRNLYHVRLCLMSVFESGVASEDWIWANQKKSPFDCTQTENVRHGDSRVGTAEDSGLLGSVKFADDNYSLPVRGRKPLQTRGLSGALNTCKRQVDIDKVWAVLVIVIEVLKTIYTDSKSRRENAPSTSHHRLVHMNCILRNSGTGLIKIITHLLQFRCLLLF